MQTLGYALNTHIQVAWVHRDLTVYRMLVWQQNATGNNKIQIHPSMGRNKTTSFGDSVLCKVKTL